MAPSGTKILIEAQPRYRDLLPDHWPLRPPPKLGESLSSWLNRLAFDNGLPARDLGEIFGTGRNMWSAQFELDGPSWLISELSVQTGQEEQTVAGTFLSEENRAWSSLLLPLRYRAQPDKATWLQFCPKCLSGDKAPFFRKRWRLATTVYCLDHKCYLLDRCPECLTGIASFAQTSLFPQHICASCGFDLRTAPTQPIDRRASRTARLLDDMLRFEHATGRSHNSELVDRISRLPHAIHWGQRELSTFSLAQRIKCLDVVAMDLSDFVGADRNAGYQFWRQWIIEKGGTVATASPLIKHITQRLNPKKQEETGPPAYDLDLYDLLYAYAKPSPQRPDQPCVALRIQQMEKEKAARRNAGNLSICVVPAQPADYESWLNVQAISAGYPVPLPPQLRKLLLTRLKRLLLSPGVDIFLIHGNGVAKGTAMIIGDQLFQFLVPRDWAAERCSFALKEVTAAVIRERPDWPHTVLYAQVSFDHISEFLSADWCHSPDRDAEAGEKPCDHSFLAERSSPNSKKAGWQMSYTLHAREMSATLQP